MTSRMGNGKAARFLFANKDYAGDDCLIYPYARSHQRGYAVFGYMGKHLYAHRFMCELAHGPAPTPAHQAAHSCGMGHMCCVNPRHLSWATNSENQRDRRRHGTHCNAKGSRTKLTEDQITQIRSLKGVNTIEEIAALYGVKRGCIEYWHRHSRPPVPAGQSPSAIAYRQKRDASRYEQTARETK